MLKVVLEQLENVLQNIKNLFMPSIDVGSRFNGVLSEINFFSRKIHGFSVIIENL